MFVEEKCNYLYNFFFYKGNYKGFYYTSQASNWKTFSLLKTIIECVLYNV